MLCGYTRKMLDYTDLTSAQRSNIPSGQTCYRPMHSIWTLDIGQETIGNKTLQRRVNVDPMSKINNDGPTLAFDVKPTSETTVNRRWTNVTLQTGMHARVKKLNPRANTPAAVKINEINPKYENTQAINQSKSRIFHIRCN